MNPLRHFLLLGAINGFLAVAFGAFAAHGLKNILSDGLLEVFQTGVEYQGLHALALLLIGLLGNGRQIRGLRLAGWAFATGILLFSGSLYLLALTDARWLGMVTPLGGTAFLVGWGALAWHASRRDRHERHRRPAQPGGEEPAPSRQMGTPRGPRGLPPV